MNGKQHKQIGAAAGAIFTVAEHIIKKKEDPDREFPWGELILNTGIGYALGSLPDIIEPATNPHHRKFFHSVTAGTLITGAAFGRHTENWDKGVKTVAQAIAVSYVSHLAADATTAFSIPIVHPKFA